ncbi:MAG: hypothetical protein A3G08_01520 [Candidatus Magasanikbacteria bacterium RIFCSPLOWO2_12_FULL_47_9b]|nr:MAG: hypothetical protein A3I74_03225 [Candidatus Magasanikbacteria bacterium RIFCSPLOWO2_02_FULL_47_16]OGH80288.1 MAG: hypothetical protein A3C10_03505 [Candidatus Magasanikbacteria bacterium RIFCSPHIGHO2_02_FULL_48_18]OGH82722.1 MAG: hypothetical protein A3G08_01520 [Candidatus Magasanikbacteria bacterium RIFCSPLOWO2_12_FULL_47_9b]
MSQETIFRNYDIRGVYGHNLTEDIVYRVAHAYAAYAHPQSVVVGYDARVSSPSLTDALVRGLLERGISIIDIGMVSTDAMYFAAWFYGYDGGVMVTASHMPKQFNGLKFLRLDERGVLSPIGRGLGMEDLERLALSDAIVEKKSVPGTTAKKDIWDDFVHFTRSFIDVGRLKPFRIVMDAGNGMGGVVARKIFAGLPVEIIPLYFEPDGTFPNHPANPIEEENRRDIMRRVVEERADLGIAWDADCDRVYFIDETGAYVHGDFVATLLALEMLEKHPGGGIVYDLRFSRALNDWVAKAGGKAHMGRVGHTYIKHQMNETQSIFGGEVSGHYYFAKNRYMENGFAPVLLLLAALSKKGKTLSEMVQDLGPYYISGEINFDVTDASLVIAAIREAYAGKGGKILTLDGVSMEYPEWHFNVRPSANDPVVRLTVEASSQSLLEEKTRELTALIRQYTRAGA